MTGASAAPPAIEIKPVDISAYRKGNGPVDYVHVFDSGRSGPTVMVNALTHGNELCGAHALHHLFEAGIRPTAGRLILSFANVEAYDQFDASQPSASRFLDEDLNRVWSPTVLDGPRQSRELTRARDLRPVVAMADYLLDLHSMQRASPPLMLCGMADKGRRLALELGCPRHVVADAGHSAGRRLRDYGDFADPASPKTALLAECGQHWAKASRAVAIEATRRFLIAVGTLMEDHWPADARPSQRPATRLIEVTEAVTIVTKRFKFTKDFQGLETIQSAGSVIAHDGRTPVRTPYDNCVLIMPSRRLLPGQTAVRLGRFVN